MMENNDLVVLEEFSQSDTSGENGDLIIYDIGFTMHRRDPFDPAEKRFLKRTSVRLPSDRHIVPD